MKALKSLSPLGVVAVLFVALSTVGCASTGEGGGRDARLLTQEELQNSQAANVFEAIERLRPRWLRTRGGRSMGGLDQGILVYLNDSPLGSPEDTLRSLPLDGIRRIEYVDSATVGSLPGAGSGHAEAGILIYTRDDR